MSAEASEKKKQRSGRFPCSFAFRLTEDDGQRLRDIADAHGYKPAEWARRIVSEAVRIDFERRAVRLRVQNADLLRQLLGELSRQGNNLNQVAKALNTFGLGDAGATVRTLEALRAQNARVVDAVLEALGANRAP